MEDFFIKAVQYNKNVTKKYHEQVRLVKMHEQCEAEMKISYDNQCQKNELLQKERKRSANSKLDKAIDEFFGNAVETYTDEIGKNEKKAQERIMDNFYGKKQAR